MSPCILPVPSKSDLTLMTSRTSSSTEEEGGTVSSSATYGGGAEDEALLRGKDDCYGGFIVDSKCLPHDEPTFTHRLRASLVRWKSQGKRGIWLKLPLTLAKLVNSAVEQGFGYHHAEPDYLMLTCWLAEDPSTLPANASHQVGVGAFVINDKTEVLVVQEASRPTQGSGVWKIPTGVVLQSEDISAGVQREVKEETGVDTEFIEVLGFRQSHRAAFGKSDLFFLCALRPISAELTPQTTEIAAVKWMPLGEFGAQPFNVNSSLLSKIVDVMEAHSQRQYTGFHPEFLKVGFRGMGSYFYHNTKDISKYLKQKSSRCELGKL